MKLKKNRKPLYREIAEHYLTAIELGTLAKNQRLPSLRDMMRTHQVSLTTVIQACRHLESEGWLEARARSGYFVRARNPSGASMHALRAPPATPSTSAEPLSEACSGIAQVLALGRRQRVTADFAVATCAPALYPAAQLRKLTVAALRDDPDILAAPAGARDNTGFKQALARRALVRGIRAAADDVLVTHGCSEALTLAVRAVTKPGDTVIVESPTYYGFLQLLESLGVKAVELPTNASHGLAVDAVEFALRGGERIAAVLNMPSLHNPLGSAMHNDAKERLVRLCQAHDVALIEDDVCGDLLPNPLAARAQKSWDDSGHVIYCTSLNKTLSPGLRLGWMLGGKWHEAVDALRMAQSRPKDELPQRVAASYLDSGGFDRHLKRLQAALRSQRDEMIGIIKAYFPPGTQVNAPDGGMLLWVRLPDGVSSLRLFTRALDEGIKIVPGAIFSPSPRFDSYVRLSCGWPLDEQRTVALERLGALSRELSVA